ncbi:MAG: AtpZ/AtpI family protein [Erysipelotrichaceae bacterium]
MNKDIVRALALAFDVISSIFFGMFVGYFIDKWLLTKPTFMIIGLFFGVAMAFYLLYEMSKKR